MSRLLVALALVVGVGLAAAPAQSATPPQVSGSVTITGDTTTPLDYTVFFQPVGSSTASGYAVSSSSFTLPTVSWPQPPGDYHVWFVFTMLDGLKRYYVAGQPAGSANEAEASIVTLGDTPTPAIVMTLPQLAHVTGTVTDGAGDGLADVTVEISKAPGYTGQHQATTDSNGRYDLGYVQAGSRTVHAYGAGDLAAAYDDVVVAASGHQVVDLTLDQEPATLEGTLTDEGTGLPISFASVDLTLRSADQQARAASTQADAEGHYLFTGLAAGTYRIAVTDELVEGETAFLEATSDASVASGSTTTHDVSLGSVHAVEPHTLSGRVIDAQGDPLPGIRISLVSPSNGTEIAACHTGRDGRWDWNAGDGDYQILARPSDRWTWLAPDSALWAPAFYPGVVGSADATTVTVSGGAPVDGLDLALVDGTALRVNVVDESGRDLRFAGYDVYDADTGVRVQNVGAGQDDPSPLVLRLQPGRWKILVRGYSTGADWKVSQWYGGGSSLSTAATIELAPGDNLKPTTLKLPETLRTTSPPRITGTPRRGHRLTATTGTWNLMTGSRFTFTWKRGSTVVDRGATHVVKDADVGKTLTVTLRVESSEAHTTVTRSLKVKIAGRH